MLAWLEIARERFELSSMAPKATMLGHYTTGLLRTLNLDFSASEF
jgi:hypothetical protein